MDERTWRDAVDQWLIEKRHKSSLHKDREIFAWLEPHLGGCLLADIDRQKLSQVAEAKAAATSYSTANRNMALVRAVLKRACEVWEWIGRVPKVPMYPVRNARVRWLTRAEASRLLSRLPPHQAAMARFGLATGLRQRNVCRLRWADVDEPNHCVRLPADRVKNRKALVVPLNRDALAVLELQRGVHPEYVFTFHGKPVWQVNTPAWHKALVAAGITDFHWHDLRHTWASWHIQSGTPVNVLQELGGWSSYEMVRRYAHLSVSHLAPYAERIVA
jgi:integrase